MNMAKMAAPSLSGCCCLGNIALENPNLYKISMCGGGGRGE